MSRTCFCSYSVLHLKIQTQSGLGIRSDFSVSNRNVCRMDGVALECGFAFKRGIEHDIGIGGGKSLGVNLDVNESRDLSCKSLKTLLDASLTASFSSAVRVSASCQRMMCFVITVFLLFCVNKIASLYSKDAPMSRPKSSVFPNFAESFAISIDKCPAVCDNDIIEIMVAVSKEFHMKKSRLAALN